MKSLLQRPRYAAFVFIVLLLLVGYPIRRSRQQTRRVSRALLLQKEAYAIAPKLRPTCPWTKWHTSRYSSLSNSPKTIFLALNLHQNEGVLPTFFQELPIVLHQLGPQNVFVSVYENGSEDKTQVLLGLRQYQFYVMAALLGQPH
jgi:alpha-1,3-mannosyltransferase